MPSCYCLCQGFYQPRTCPVHGDAAIAARSTLDELFKTLEIRKPTLPGEWNVFVDWTQTTCFVIGKCTTRIGLTTTIGPQVVFDAPVPTEDVLRKAIDVWNEYCLMIEDAILTGQCRCQ